MSDTPQTDAKAVSVIGFYSCATVPADFARCLERERNEARDTVLRLRKQRAISRNFGEQMERERDEARHTASALNRRLTKAEGIIEAAHLIENRPTKGGGGLGRALANYSADKYMRERDEARRLLAAAKESLNAIHVEVGGWIAAMMKEGK